jgi:subtilisin family serine protease
MKKGFKNILSISSLLTLMAVLSLLGSVMVFFLNTVITVIPEEQSENIAKYVSNYETSQPDLTTETLLDKGDVIFKAEMVQEKQGVIKENVERKVIHFSQELTDSDKKKIETEYNVSFTEDIGQNGVYVVNTNLSSKVDELEDSGIVYAMEVDIPIKLLSQTVDWGIERVAANKVWKQSTGSGVVVAVIDTGVQLDHEDLASNITTGFDFVNNKSSAYDDNGHGTHVAGIVAAQDNVKGVIGVANNTKIMPIKVLNAQGYGYLSDVAKGIYYATDNNARIINLSLGTSTHSTILRDAVRYAYGRGVLIVGAAGNNAGQPCLYPAAYDEVICVVATNKDNKLASFSNIGGELAAPGVSNYSTYIGGRYAYLSGTSMAAPHVSGVASLIFSYCSVCTHSEVRRTLWNTAVDLGETGRDSLFGHGLVDSFNAITSFDEVVLEEEVPFENEEEVKTEKPKVSKGSKILPNPKNRVAVREEIMEQVQERLQSNGVKIRNKSVLIQNLILLEPELPRNKRLVVEVLEDINLKFRLNPLSSESDIREISLFIDNEKVLSTTEQEGEYLFAKEDLTNSQYIIKIVASFNNGRVVNENFILDLTRLQKVEHNNKANPARPANKRVLGISTFFSY